MRPLDLCSFSISPLLALCLLLCITEAVGPCGLLFKWIFSSVSGAISQRTGNDCELCCWPSTQTSSRLHELQCPNQVQALYIDCLELLFLLLQKRFSTRVWLVFCHLGLLVLRQSHSQAVCDGAVVLVRFHPKTFYTVLKKEKVSDYLSRDEGDKWDKTV